MAELTLAQQIAQLDDTAPTDVDVERLDGGLVEDGEQNWNLLAGRDHYLDVGVSSLRRQRDALVDPKYDGARATRSQLYESEQGSDDSQLELQVDDPISDSDRSVEEEDAEKQNSEDGDTPDLEEKLSSHETSPSDQENDEENEHDSPNEPAADNLAETLKRSREADRAKGQAIIRQRGLWDSLVETRIRLQKSATASNRLPQPDRLAPYVTSDAGRESAQELLREVLAFSEDLETLRRRLLTINEPDCSMHPPKRRKLDAEDYENQIQDATLSMTELDAAYHGSCVRTLQKWSSKIAAVTPALSRGKSFRGGGAPRSAVELIEDALGESGTHGGGKAIGRTRVRRTEGPRIGDENQAGEDKGVEGDAEVFDDLDFYQTMLRDVIDGRVGVSGSEDWSARQRIRKSKKVVDTKASKGRKLRYETHEKLENFMVPISAGIWHEEQIDELFANLLGRGVDKQQAMAV